LYNNGKKESIESEKSRIIGFLEIKSRTNKSVCVTILEMFGIETLEYSGNCGIGRDFWKQLLGSKSRKLTSARLVHACSHSIDRTLAPTSFGPRSRTAEAQKNSPA
jgi:hypothetical protein